MTPENRAWLAVAWMLVLGVWIYVVNELLLSISWWWSGAGA